MRISHRRETRDRVSKTHDLLFLLLLLLPIPIPSLSFSIGTLVALPACSSALFLCLPVRAFVQLSRGLSQEEMVATPLVTIPRHLIQCAGAFRYCVGLKFIALHILSPDRKHCSLPSMSPPSIAKGHSIVLQCLSNLVSVCPPAPFHVRQRVVTVTGREWQGAQSHSPSHCLSSHEQLHCNVVLRLQ